MLTSALGFIRARVAEATGSGKALIIYLGFLQIGGSEPVAKNHSMNESDWLYLFSSNVRLQYFTDCLRALMLPRGSVLHFRYLKQHVDPSVWTRITDSPSWLIGKSVLVLYLFQEPIDDNKWRPMAFYPMRKGKVVDVDYAGASVHLYFELENFPNQQNLSDVNSAAETALFGNNSDRSRVYVASCGQALSTEYFSDDASTDKRAFTAIVDALPEEHLRPAAQKNGSQQIQYDPIFVRVDGLKPPRDSAAARGKTIIDPTSLALGDRERGYEVTDEAPYSLTISFHQPKWSKAHDNGRLIRFETSQANFSNPEQTDIHIASPYDQQDVYLMPKKSRTGWISRARLHVPDLKPLVTDGKEVRFIAPDWDCWFHSKPSINLQTAQVLDFLTGGAPAALALFALMFTSTAPVPALVYVAVGLFIVALGARSAISKGISD